jgi:hypothetical protein
MQVLVLGCPETHYQPSTVGFNPASLPYVSRHSLLWRIQLGGCKVTLQVSSGFVSRGKLKAGRPALPEAQIGLPRLSNPALSPFLVAFQTPVVKLPVPHLESTTPIIAYRALAHPIAMPNFVHATY